MAKGIKFNFEQYDGQIMKASMKRLNRAARLVQRKAKRRCVVGTVNRPVYETGAAAGKLWTGRQVGAMRETIRVVERYQKYGKMIAKFGNVRVYAGNKETWWAVQMEYGKGGWVDGRKSFLRPALRESKSKIQMILGKDYG